MLPGVRRRDGDLPQAGGLVGVQRVARDASVRVVRVEGLGLGPPRPNMSSAAR
ncbi:hypothetical protein ACQP2T_31200 [Nonomuraea sp. CA-143628]|uniref:hypothetical protein n=1 Tax=Nonomuraea sp. CA-143628 TaxID=3239997 RepID=UPI003D8E5565